MNKLELLTKIILAPIERETPIKDNYIPKNDDEFMAFINSATLDRLVEVGFLDFCNFKEGSKDYGLFIFPGEWYNAIPNGFEVTTIILSKSVFDKNTFNNDVRFGCLSFGVIREIK